MSPPPRINAKGQEDCRMGTGRVAVFSPAPDFELADSEGRPVRLSAYRGVKHVVLIFNRGFV